MTTDRGIDGISSPWSDGSRSYQRGWLRGDLVAGDRGAALIVPKNLGLRRDRGHPVQNGLYAAAAGAILYARFGTSRQISTGPSSGLAAVAASAVVAAKVTGTQDVASFVGDDHPGVGRTVPTAGGVQDGLDRPVPLAGSGHRLSLRGGHRRGDRRASQADRHRCGRLEPAPGAAVVVRDFERRQHGDRSVGGVSLAVVSDYERSRRASLERSYWWSAACWRRGSSTSAPTASPWSATCQGTAQRGAPEWQLVSDHASVIALAAVALVLIGFSQTAGDSRTFAAKHRYRIDINQESVAQGMSNAAPACSRECPSPRACRRAPSTTTPAPARAWPRSPPGVIVLLTLLVLAPLFSKLPKPVLAA